MYKTVEEVQAALAVRLPQDQLKDVGGYSYVPWEITARQLTDIFGPFGWEERITAQQYDTQKGIYIVSRRLVGYASVTEAMGDETYTHTVTIEREGVGVGIAVDQSGRAHDTAIKGADSDSFSRAAKKLGDAFGLYLYDRNDPARQVNHGNVNTSASTRPAVNGTVTGPRAASADGREFSEKQTKFLHDLGWTDAAIRGMSYQQGKAVMDGRQRAPQTEPTPAPEGAGALPF